MTELRCVDCIHRPHVGRCGKDTTRQEIPGTCRCTTEINRDLSGSDIHQKSEGCWCGAHIDVEGSEQDVVGACTNFRNGHRHKQPSKEDRVKGLLEDRMQRLTKTMDQESRIDLQGEIHGLSLALAIMTDMTVLGIKPVNP